MYTAEVRWFFNHPVAMTTLLKIFPHQMQPERHDFYLLHTGNHLGIKWREGNVEIKQRQEESQPYRKDNLSGQLEFWKKWSFALKEEKALQAFLNPGHQQHWMKMEKQRTLLLFVYDLQERKTSPVSPDSEVEAQCELEVTRIVINEKAFYTIGLEASGPTERLKEILDGTIEYVLNKINLKEWHLSLQHAESYPSWIEKNIEAWKHH